MSRTKKLVVVVLAAGVLVIAAGGAAFWYFVLRDDTPGEPELPERELTEDEAEAPPPSVDGTWTVVPASETETVFVGYRVQELFAGETLQNTAVGRTSAVSGTMTIRSDRVVAVEVVADMTQLQSDQDRRDNHLRANALETDTFPEARFALGEPIDLGSIPEPGEVITTNATGALTLRDVTQEVTIEVEARWTGEIIDMNGLVPIVFTDYGISTPNIPGLVSVEDEGQMEFQLAFAPA